MSAVKRRRRSCIAAGNVGAEVSRQASIRSGLSSTISGSRVSNRVLRKLNITGVWLQWLGNSRDRLHELQSGNTRGTFARRNHVGDLHLAAVLNFRTTDIGHPRRYFHALYAREFGLHSVENFPRTARFKQVPSFNRSKIREVSKPSYERRCTR